MATRALRKDAGQSQGEGPKHNHVFRDFRGINTQAARQAIESGQFSWIENVMPIGHGNAAIVPSRSAVLQSVEAGSCYYLHFYSINGLPYMFMATDAGIAYQVLLNSPHTRTQIFASFSTYGLQIAQWKDERILIIDPVNGYFTWDGTNLTENAQVVAVEVTAGGTGYTTIPTISFTGGGGAGAAAFASMQVEGTPAVTAGGTGYVVGDILTLTGGTYVTPAKVRVDTVALGVVTAVSIFDAGEYTVLPTSPVATTGGGNDDCTITPTYAVSKVTVTNGGTAPYDSAPTVVFSSGAAAATAFLLQGPPNGQHIASYSGRVWISSNRTISYSAPDSYYDFSGTGSGLTVITDETLIGEITQLLAANGFLYFSGVSSVNAIGDVQVNNAGDTVFSNTNLSASVGTDLSDTPLAYYRAVWMMNKSGVYSIYGSTPAKVSDDLDGIFQNIDFSFPVSSAQFSLKNILCSAFLAYYVDSTAVVTRPILVVFFNKKWFVASQGAISFITSGVVAGSQICYATDGSNLYRLFDDEVTPVPWSMSGAFWDMDDVTKGKQVTKFGLEMTLPTIEGQVSFSIESLSSQPPYAGASTYSIDVSSAVQWVNNSEEEVLWLNNSGEVVDWLGSGYFLDMQDGSQYGKYIGTTIASDSVTGKITSQMIEYTYRENW